jgi:uncharacterized protein (DUF849 family)
MINVLPQYAIYSAGIVSNSHLLMNAIDIIAARSVRVGIERDVWYDEEKASTASNRDLVERIMVIEKAMGRKPLGQSVTMDLIGV